MGDTYNDDPMRGMTPVQPQLFDADAEDPSEWLVHLRQHGYVVFRSFLPVERRRELLRGFWRDFSAACRKNKHIHRAAGGDAFSHVKRTDRSTWVTPAGLGGSAKHAPMHIAQSDFFWDLRTQPQMAKVCADDGAHTLTQAHITH